MVTGVMLVLFLCCVRTRVKWQLANCAGDMPCFCWVFWTKKATWLVLRESLVIPEEFARKSRITKLCGYLCMCVCVSKQAGDQLSGRKSEEERKKYCS